LVNDNDQLIAVLVLNDLSNTHLAQKEITQTLKDLDDWSIPKKYYVIESIPMNEMRKSDLKALEEGIRNQSLEFLLEWNL
jgi:acyl-CoA synthetase (AMP-forming)/AMP-acid ligase II